MINKNMVHVFILIIKIINHILQIVSSVAIQHIHMVVQSTLTKVMTLLFKIVNFIKIMLIYMVLVLLLMDMHI